MRKYLYLKNDDDPVVPGPGGDPIPTPPDDPPPDEPPHP